MTNTHFFRALVLGLLLATTQPAWGDEHAGDDDDFGHGDDDDLTFPEPGSEEPLTATVSTILAEQRDGDCGSNYQGAILDTPGDGVSGSPLPAPYLEPNRPGFWLSAEEQGDRGGSFVEEYLDCRTWEETADPACGACQVRCEAVQGSGGVLDLWRLKSGAPMLASLGPGTVLLPPIEWTVQQIGGGLQQVSGVAQNVRTGGDPPFTPDLQLTGFDLWSAEVSSDVLNEDIQVHVSGFVEVGADYDLLVDYDIGFPLGVSPFTERLVVPRSRWEFTLTFQLQLIQGDPSPLSLDPGFVDWRIVDVTAVPDAPFGFFPTGYSGTPSVPGGWQFLGQQRYENDVEALAQAHVERSLHEYALQSEVWLGLLFLDYLKLANPLTEQFGEGPFGNKDQFILSLDLLEADRLWEGSVCDVGWNDSYSADPDKTGGPLGIAVTFGGWAEPGNLDVPEGLPVGGFDNPSPTPAELAERIYVGTFGLDQNGAIDPGQALSWPISGSELDVPTPMARRPVAAVDSFDEFGTPLYSGLLDVFFNLGPGDVNCSDFGGNVDAFCAAVNTANPGACSPGAATTSCVATLTPAWIAPGTLSAAFPPPAGTPPGGAAALCGTIPSVAVSSVSYSAGVPGDPECPGLNSPRWDNSPGEDQLELVLDECLVATGSISAQVYVTFADPNFTGGGPAAPGCPVVPPGSEPWDLVPPPYNLSAGTVWQPGSAPVPYGVMRLTVSGDVSFGFEWSHRVPFRQHLTAESQDGPPMVGWDPWVDWFAASLEYQPMNPANPNWIGQFGNAFSGNGDDGKYVDVSFALGTPSVTITGGEIEGGPTVPLPVPVIFWQGNPIGLVIPPTQLSPGEMGTASSLVSSAFGSILGGTLGEIGGALSGDYPNWAETDLEGFGLIHRANPQTTLVPGLIPYWR